MSVAFERSFYSTISQQLSSTQLSRSYHPQLFNRSEVKRSFRNQSCRPVAPQTSSPNKTHSPNSKLSEDGFEAFPTILQNRYFRYNIIMNEQTEYPSKEYVEEVTGRTINDNEPYGFIYLVRNSKSNRCYVGQTKDGISTSKGLCRRYPTGWI